MWQLVLWNISKLRSIMNNNNNKKILTEIWKMERPENIKGNGNKSCAHDARFAEDING